MKESACVAIMMLVSVMRNLGISFLHLKNWEDAEDGEEQGKD
jgi:hypothetical protein